MRLRLLARSILPLLAAALTLGLSGCDNGACIFSGTCPPTGGGGGGIGSEPARQPSNLVWLDPAVPTLTRTFPSGASVSSSTPFAISFSESLNPDTVDGAFELFLVGGPPAPQPMQPAQLVGDGRLLVLLPALPLQSGMSYDLRWAEGAVVTDLQGSPVGHADGALLRTFTVAGTNPTTPSIVAQWPPEASTNASTTTEIVVIFDRPMNAATVSNASFAVSVGGSAPPLNPAPTSLMVSTGGATLPDTRGYTWRSVDNLGRPVSLGTNSAVQVRLSSPPNVMFAMDGSQLASTTLGFTLAPISAPLSADLVSMPLDAIGIDNISGPTSLDVAVSLEDGQVGDRIGIFVFGFDKGGEPQLIGQFREFTLTAAAMVVNLGEAEVDLNASATGVQGRFADGELTLAFRLQRGNVVTPVRLLDVDMNTAAIEHPLFDTTRPDLIGWGARGTETFLFRSDQRDLALLGRATEPLRSVEVTSALGNNGTLPDVVASSASGLFLAQTAPIGGLLTSAQEPLTFSATLYDRALNASAAPFAGRFTQVGHSGPGVALPNATITIDVSDAATLDPLGGTRVMTHRIAGGATTFLDSGFTNPVGRVTLVAPASGEVIVSVDRSGYDLWSFHGPTTDALSILLERSIAAPSVATGVVLSKNPNLTLAERFVGDSRVPPDSEALASVSSCSFNPVTSQYTCAYGPFALRSGPVGSRTFLAVESPPNLGAYNPLTFLLGFAINVPLLPPELSSPTSGGFTVNTLLSDPGVDPEERAIDGPTINLNGSGLTVLQTGMLDMAPRARIEARVPGMPATALVGLGVPFDAGGAQWTVRCAYPGAADGIDNGGGDQLGSLVTSGTIEPDLLLALELRDQLGSRTIFRRPFSVLGANAVPIDAPLWVAPPIGGSSGASSDYDVTFRDVIPDSLGQNGVYRVRLISSVTGRGWILYRSDAPDAQGPTRSVRLPDLTQGGGTNLANGQIVAAVSAYAWPGLDPNAWSFSEVGREAQYASQSAPATYTQP